MIDTLHLFLNSSYLPTEYNLHLESILTQHHNKPITHGQTSIGLLKNLYVKYNQNGLYISNSWAEYKFGNNIQTLRLSQIKEIIEELTKIFGLPIIESKVLRIDIAENITTNFPIKQYFQVLGNVRSLFRYSNSNGLDFQSTNRCLSLYDKSKEAKKKKMLIKPLRSNLLRLEYRLKNHRSIKSKLRIQDVTLKDVIGNYQMLVDSWFEIYQSIDKLPPIIKFKPELLQQKGGLLQQLKVLGVQSLGGTLKVCEMLDNAKPELTLKHSNVITNAKKQIRDLMKNPTMIESCDLQEELTQKVKLAHQLASEQRIDEILLNHG